jgi:hypothetical protein
MSLLLLMLLLASLCEQEEEEEMSENWPFSKKKFLSLFNKYLYLKTQSPQ